MRLAGSATAEANFTVVGGGVRVWVWINLEVCLYQDWNFDADVPVDVDIHIDALEKFWSYHIHILIISYHIHL